MCDMDRLDAYTRPPDEIKKIYKIFQKLESTALDSHPDLLDISDMKPSKRPDLPTDSREAFLDFLESDGSISDANRSGHDDPRQVYEVATVPGK